MYCKYCHGIGCDRCRPSDKPRDASTDPICRDTALQHIRIARDHMQSIAQPTVLDRAVLSGIERILLNEVRDSPMSVVIEFDPYWADYQLTLPGGVDTFSTNDWPHMKEVAREHYGEDAKLVVRQYHG